MDGSDYPQDEQLSATGKVPSLLHDYRAQRDAWREQARNLARMREEVLSAADREAKDIVTTARTDIRSILLKARRDLLVLAAQVRAAGRLGDAEDASDAAFLPPDELGQAHTSLTAARHDIRQVLDESRPELEGLISEGEALRAALRQQRPPAPTPVRQAQQYLESPIEAAGRNIFSRSEPTIDFDFTTIAAEQPTEFSIRKRRPARAFIAAAATLGGLALMGTTWWLFRTPTVDKPAAVESSATAVAGSGRPESKNAVRSPIPDTRSPLTIGLTARRTAWLRVTADGRVTAERTFKAGETQLINATREVSIRAGDAGAVTVSVGGRQPVALGREGEVLTRKFTVPMPRAEGAVSERPITPKPGPVAAVAEAAPKAPPVAAVVPPASIAASNSSRVTTQPPVTPPAPTPPPPSLPSSGATSAPRSAAAAVDRPAAAPASAPAAASPPSVEDSLTSAASRWLDAYYRQDRATMASISPQVNVTDDRGDKERLPRGLAGVRRTLEDVNVQVVNSEAIFTAKMTERMENIAAGQSAQAVSFVSHMWTQRNGSWQLHDVRIVSASTLGRSLR
jgi:hypothetical protein